MSDNSIAVALGRVLATVEHSLHRWERGKCQNSAARDHNLSQDSSVFSSFLGKSRINLALLEQPIGDNEDEDEIALAHLLEKSHRPMLRDLSVDPATLCKAASAFQRLSVTHPHLQGGWILTQVAIRLLSSKNARLMKECSIHDVIFLTEAAALSDVDGHGRELIIGLFARKVVQVLNQALRDQSSGRRELSLVVSDAAASEIATLLWSLGELGARHQVEDDASFSSYRRMRVVSERPFLSNEQIQGLKFPFLSKLVSDNYV